VLDEEFVRLNPEARVGAHVVLQVADTGTGIAPELLEKIFDPFFTTKDPGKGTGLGLSTVLGIVKGHQGFVQVQSRLGSGTQFRVFLPALHAEKLPARAARPSVLAQGRGEIVLLVDDEEPVRKVAKHLLEANGYRVITACDGAEGLTSFRHQQESADVVLTDVVMPVLDGPAMVRGLRQLEPGLRVIAMSGLQSSHPDSLGLEMSVDAFLHKPFTPVQLLDTLRRVLSLNSKPPGFG
jgi:two-component system cell cycle sensor histidine kinase/response regulator CckA